MNSLEMNIVNALGDLKLTWQRSAIAAVLSVFFAGSLHAQRLFLSGGPAVYEVHPDKDNGKEILKIDWVWKPEESSGLPGKMAEKFMTTDDCKPVSDGKEVLITSSGGAVALVLKATRETLFFANVHNAHSAELLPDGLIAAMSSVGAGGDQLLIYDRKHSDQILTSLPIPSAHGVVWDAGRNILWALGGKELFRIKVVPNQEHRVDLVVEHSYPLPSRGGHDLQLALDGSTLYVTTLSEVLTFLPDQEQFKPFAPLAGVKNVKSFSIQRETGQLAYTQASDNVWWTYTVHLRHPDADIPFDSFLYKLRWDTNAEVAATP
jgi:Family of unknown function (DUF6528)